MNYFDEEVIKDFQNHNAELIILTEAECDLLINAISSLPFSGIQIAWKSLKGSTYLGTMESLEAQNSLVEKIISASDDDILIIGDTADNAYSIDVKTLALAIEIFSQLPQHTFITQKNLSWIACISFRGHIDFSTL
ncbi:hypothetical protein [Pseudomonas sp. TE24901]